LCGHVFFSADDADAHYARGVFRSISEGAIMKTRFAARIAFLSLSLLLGSSVAFAQNYAPPFPRDGAEKVLENENFIIWNVKYEKGKSTGMRKLDLDQISVVLSEGAVKVSKPDGTWAIEQERLATVRFQPKGTIVETQSISDDAAGETVFQLKDAPAPPSPPVAGVADLFPRVGAVKLFETDRISVWDASWRPGERIGRHMHYRRSAFVFIDGGRIRSITNEGIPEPPFSRKRGDVVIVRERKDPHEEEEVEGTPRAIWVGFN
jgi:hypothetical protein